MEPHYWELFILLLCLASSLGQNDDTAADTDTDKAASAATDAAKPADTTAAAKPKPPETKEEVKTRLKPIRSTASELLKELLENESLKTEPNRKALVENLLTKALNLRNLLNEFINDLKLKPKELNDAEEGEKRKIEKNMEHIITLLETSLDKLVDDNAANEGNLKAIQGELNKFHVAIDNEFVRIQNLDNVETTTSATTSISKSGKDGCNSLQKLLTSIKAKIETIMKDKTKMIDQLLEITKSIDVEINSYYDRKRKCHEGKKNDLNDLRKKNNDVFDKLRSVDNFDPMTNSDLQQYEQYIETRLENVKQSPDPSPSCLENRLKEFIKKTEAFDLEDGQQVALDMSEYIDKTTKELNDALKKESSGDPLTEEQKCDQIWGKLFETKLAAESFTVKRTAGSRGSNQRFPWPISKTRLETVVETLQEKQKKLQRDPQVVSQGSQVSQVSGNAGSSTPTATSKCENGELDQVNEYMSTLDGIKLDTRNNFLGDLVKFRENLGKRKKDLYADKLLCSKEIDQTNKYRKAIDQCSDELGKLTDEAFGELQPSKKTSCILKLRVELQNRREDLHTSLLNNKF